MADQENSGGDKVNLQQIGEQFKSLDLQAKSFGKSVSSAFAAGIVQGKKFEDILKSVGQRLIEIGLKAAFKPIENSISDIFGQVLKATAPQASSLTGALGGSFNLSGLFGGGVGAPLDIRPVPFAEGGIIAAPSFFPLSGGLGLAGERGAEAIMPLARGPDGRLGVTGAGGGATSVTVNISTPDVESFRRSDAQISTALARAVARGQRGL